MITAIDTNILVDIFGADLKFGESSAQALRDCLRKGKVCACEIVWAETASIFPKRNDFMKAMDDLEIEFSAMNKESALLASEMWAKYRKKNNNKRTRVVADFLIGAHGLNQADQLLTRDRGFYRDSFSSLVVLEPALIELNV